MNPTIEGDKFVKITRHGTARSYDKVEGFAFELLVQSENLELMLVHVAAKAETEVFRHPGEEAHLVLDGELEVIVDGRIYRLYPGDAIWHRSDRPHKWRNPTDKSVRVVAFASPRTSISRIIAQMKGE